MAGRIDKDVVLQMGRTGFSRAEIARRCGCSTKQVGRILGAGADRKLSRIVEQTEDVMREFFLVVESGADASKRFGISRQAIFNSNNNRSN